MKTLTYTQPHDLAGLHGELIAAVPSLAPVDGPRGRKEAVFSLSGDGDSITLEVPSASNTAAIDAVVAAHDPSPYIAARQQKAAEDATAATNEVAVRDQAKQKLDQLRQARTVLAGTPTDAQRLQALRLHNDVLLALLKLEVRDLLEAD